MFRVKLRLFSYQSVQTCVLDAQKNRLNKDGSFEYPQHMFGLSNKKNNFQLRTLNWGLIRLFVL